MHFIYLLVFIVIGVNSLMAQQVHFKNYNTESGLPSPEAYAVFCDSKGYIWIGTDAGVCRFDGYSFEKFDVQSGLPDNTVYSIKEDTKGRIWFKHRNILSYWNLNKVSAFAGNNILNEKLSTILISTFYIDKNDTLWISSNSRGYYKIAYPYAEKDFNHISLLDDIGSSYFIKEINPSAYIFGNLPFSKNTLRYFDAHNKPYPYAFIAKYDSVTSTLINLHLSFSKTNDKYFLFTNSQELLKISGRTAEHKYDFAGEILNVFEDRERNIWLSTTKGAVFIEKGDLRANKTTVFFPRLTVTEIVQDLEGGIWLSTLTEGVYYLRSNKVLHYSKQEGLKEENINVMLDIGNNSLLLASKYCVTLFSHGKMITRKMPIDLIASINYLFKHSNGSIWSGGDTGKGLIFSKNLKNAQKYPVFVKAITEGNDKNVWVGNHAELYKFSYTDHRILQKIHTGFKLSALCEDHTGRLWIGALDGLRYYHGNNIQRYQEQNLLFSSKIADIKEAKTNQLYIATKGKGIIVISKNEQINTITKADGLVSDFCKRLFIDKKGNVWVGTNAGISCITNTDAKPQIRNYNTSDGLISNEINDIVVRNDTVFAATNKGLIVFKPADLPVNIPPSIYITNITASGKVKAFTQELTIPYSENYVIINYKGLSYKDFGHVAYKYKMEGLDKNWFYSSNTSVQYPSLEPGTYKFYLYAINSNGLESKVPIYFTIIITPPFWKTWWFISLFILFVFSALFFAISLRIKHIQRAEEVEKKTLRNQLKALQSQMNPHFIFNCLNSIQRYILDNDSEKSQRFLSKFAKLMRYVLDHSNVALIGLEEELDAIRLYLELETSRLKGKIDYTIIIADDLSIAAIKIPSMIIQPYIENAIWHAFNDFEKKGIISLSLYKKSEEILACIIEDNGIGRKKSSENKSVLKTHKSVGMNVTKERLEIINYLNKHKLNVNIVDKEDADGNSQGTRVELFIPINH